jgi:hypothetical protein
LVLLLLFCFFNSISYGFSGAGIDGWISSLFLFSSFLSSSLLFPFLVYVYVLFILWHGIYLGLDRHLVRSFVSSLLSPALLLISLRCTSFGYISWVDWAGGRWNRAYIYRVRAFASWRLCLAGIALGFSMLLDTLKFTTFFVPCLFASRCMDVMFAAWRRNKGKGDILLDMEIKQDVW